MINADRGKEWEMHFNSLAHPPSTQHTPDLCSGEASFLITRQLWYESRCECWQKGRAAQINCEKFQQKSRPIIVRKYSGCYSNSNQIASKREKCIEIMHVHIRCGHKMRNFVIFRQIRNKNKKKTNLNKERNRWEQTADNDSPGIEHNFYWQSFIHSFAWFQQVSMSNQHRT